MITTLKDSFNAKWFKTLFLLMLAVLAGGGLPPARSAAEADASLSAPGLTARFDKAAPTAAQGQDLIPLDRYI